jgi:excisionase family DNA binding protein
MDVEGQPGALTSSRMESRMNVDDKKLAPVMTVEDIAGYLRIPISSVYKLARAGRIPGQKVGRHWRFHRVTIENWLAGTSADSASKQ